MSYRTGSRVVLVLALALTFGLALSTPTSAQTREGFWFGIGGGGGRAHATCDGCDANDENGGSGYVKAGWTLNPHVLIGGELNVWTKKKDFGDLDAWFTIYNASATLTFYPSATGGFFVKGGGGVAYLDTDIKQRGSTTTIDLGSGPGFIVGAGYDVPLGRGRMALTPAVNVWYGTIGELRSRGTRIASGWNQRVVDVTIGLTFP